MSNFKHGDTVGCFSGKKPPYEYRVWDAMIQRCENPKTQHYDRYGGRGIRVCERWRNSYADFLSDMGRAPPKTKIERINNDGHYEPGNCRWATTKEQARNMCRNHWITHPTTNERLTITDWAARLGINAGPLLRRIRGGMLLETALSLPPLGSRTHCKRGHEYTQENTKTSRGFRECVECQKIRGRRKTS
mgnify:CR=1 FL=1